MSAVISRATLEHNLGWAEDYPQFARESLFEFYAKYTSDYKMTVDESRDGFVRYVAELSK